MAVKKVIVILGQSNAEGRADKTTLPSALRGPQVGRYIYNYDNNAREVLDCDGVGANLPNNTTFHVVGEVGPEMQLAKEAYDELGEIDIFKFAVGGSGIAPSLTFPYWHPYAVIGLFADFKTRWTAYKAMMAGLGHTLDVLFVSWYQGENDAGNLGSDLAYYGNYTAFIQEVRDYLANDSTSEVIRWICYLVHEYAQILILTPLIGRLKNIRAAQRKAGWSDPEYRVIDTNKYSYKPDILHIDTQGVVDAGTDAWLQWKSTVNNSMAFETYNLASLRTRLGEEFGIDITINANLQAIDRRINDAVSWIVNRRKNWPWLERNTEFTVGETALSVTTGKRYGAGLFILSDTTVRQCSYSGTPMKIRELVDFGGTETEGLLVGAVNSMTATTLTLRHRYQGDAALVGTTLITVGAVTTFQISLTSSQGNAVVIPRNVPTFGVTIVNANHTLGTYTGTYYATRVSDTEFTIPVNSTGHIVTTLGTAQIAIEFVIGERYVEMPDDFIRADSLHSEEPNQRNTVVFRPPTIFERLVKEKRNTTTLNRIYTVQKDPLNLSNKAYIGFYPHYTDREVLYLKYFGDAKKMVADDDESHIPRSDSFALWSAAAWFVAQWQKEDSAAFYRASALNELERMTKEYQLSDDVTEGSDIDSDSDHVAQGPDGYPEFEIY